MITGKFLSSVDDWSQVLALRSQIFSAPDSICPAQPDEHDALAIYAITFDEDGTPGACGRLFMDIDNVATIGCVGSVEQLRGRGLADLVMRMLLYRVLEMKLPLVKLVCQSELAPFFERYGLTVDGSIEPISGVDCVKMSALQDKINIEGKCKHR